MKLVTSLLLFVAALWFFVATERPPAATAVPLAAYSTALPPAAIVGPDTAVNQAAPSPSGAGAELLRIEAAGRVWELTPARLVDCINAQQNDQPTGPTCPPNAATYAGMLGQGR